MKETINDVTYIFKHHCEEEDDNIIKEYNYFNLNYIKFISLVSFMLSIFKILLNLHKY